MRNPIDIIRGMRRQKSGPHVRNVILMVLDALRWDGLSSYGNMRKTSPNIDKLAKRGTIFTQAISAAGATPGAMGAIVASKYPYFVTETFSGPRELSDFGFSRFAEDGESIAKIPRNLGTLSEEISGAGITTAGFTANPLTIQDFGFHKGFEKYEDFNNKNWDTHPDARDVNRKVEEWLSQNHARRFFMYIHYMDTHLPYIPEPPYNRMFKADYLENKTDLELNGDWYQSSDKSYQRRLLSHMRALYDASIRYLDDQIGKIFRVFEKYDIFDNSLIILLSDHGDEFLEHGGTLHHNPKLHDELIRVPLIVHFPNRPIRRRISQLVRTIDLAPTILGFIDIDQPSQFDGRSLVSVLRGADCQSSELTAYADAPYRRAVRTEKWKLIHSEKDDSFELYDLVNDARESNNLFASRSDIADIMFDKLNQLKHEILKEGRGLDGSGEGVGGKSLDEETARRLRGLGYL